LTAPTVKQLTSILLRNKQIRKLNLHACRIGDENVAELAPALGLQCHLTYLNLHYNKLVGMF